MSSALVTHCGVNMAFEGIKRKYSSQDKEKFARLAEEYKNEYEKERKENEKKNLEWDRQRKRFVTKLT